MLASEYIYYKEAHAKWIAWQILINIMQILCGKGREYGDKVYVPRVPRRVLVC